MFWRVLYFFFFFFNDTATTEIYTLSLHDALPISTDGARPWIQKCDQTLYGRGSWLRNRSLTLRPLRTVDRKSTRLNSSHLVISYAVFCLKKKNKKILT